MSETTTRRNALYVRVSSDEQKERASIQTQIQELERRLATEPDVVLIDSYVDDGVSGTIAMEDRPGGKRLMRDARRGRFDEIWVFKLDRVGRDDIDPLLVRRELARLGIKLFSLHDNIEGNLEYALRVAIAAEERRTLIQRTTAGMERAAREGRFCGGIVPLGYRVDGKQQTARLAISHEPIWREWSESDVARQIFRWSASDGWSCRKVADQLNSLGVPTSYQKAGRCVRKKRTRGQWTPGRIRQILMATVYKGIYQYGKRNKGREPIVAPVPAIVNEALWDAAQETLHRHHKHPKGTRNLYVLRSVIKSGPCGVNYTGSVGRAVTWYKCNGKTAWRGKQKGKPCDCKALDGRVIEPLIQADLERWLLNPGDVVQELAAEQNANGATAIAEAERALVASSLQDVAEQRNRMLDIYRRGRISADEVDVQMDAIAVEQGALEKRLAELAPRDEPQQTVTDETLLTAIRERVRAGLSRAELQQIVALLVDSVTVHSSFDIDGKKRCRVVIRYRFPAVHPTGTGTGSSPPRA